MTIFTLGFSIRPPREFERILRTFEIAVPVHAQPRPSSRRAPLSSREHLTRWKDELGEGASRTV